MIQLNQRILFLTWLLRIVMGQQQRQAKHTELCYYQSRYFTKFNAKYTECALRGTPSAERLKRVPFDICLYVKLDFNVGLI